MKKMDNFKIYFSGVLKDKFHLNKDQIKKYFEIKEKQESFDNKKLIGSMVGLGELIGASLIGIVDSGNNSNFAIPIIILSGVGVLTTKISVTRRNPYYLKEYKEIDYLYSCEKSQYKKKK